MIQRKVLLSNAIAGMVDQALLSALNFSIGLLFIRLASKEEYGLYTLFFGFLMLSQSLQSALTGAPLVALGPKLPDERTRTLSEQLLRLQTQVSIALAVLSLIGVWITDQIASIPQLDMTVAGGFVIALIGQWLREYARVYHYLKLRPGAALFTDVLYGVVLLLGLAAVAIGLETTATWVMLITGIASAVAGLQAIFKERIGLGSQSEDAKALMQRAWAVSRWTLPGTVIDWLSRNTFAIIVGAIAGLAAAAEISAARLLLMPAGLCVTAWGKVFGPRFAGWWSKGETHALDSVSRASAIALIGIVAAWSAALILSFDLLLRYVLGEDYAAARELLPIWAIYFAITAIRQIGTVTLAAGERFRAMFHYGWIATLVGLPAAVALTLMAGTKGAIYGLILGEAVLAALMLGWGVRRMRAEGNTAPAK